MTSCYFRELQRYTKSDIENALKISEEKTNAILRRLKEYGVVKTTKGDPKDLSDLLEDTEEISDVETSGNQIYYVFCFVGVITLDGIVFKIYPKYLPSACVPAKEYKQVMDVLREYNKRKSIVRIYNESDDGHSFNLLAIMLYIMQDYWDNGLYTNTENIIETNGAGDIIWDRTIDESFVYIQKNRPYYLELKTRKTKVDDYDFFKRLHECILTEISNELKGTKDESNEDDISLLELFELEEIELSDEKRDAFGENEYLLRRIEKELSVQFNTKKQNTLKLLFTYISQNNKFSSTDCLSLFGTTAFHAVWEDVCSSILDNQLQKTLQELPLRERLKDPFDRRKNERLIDLIAKPHWEYIGDDNERNSYSGETLEPDIISIVDSDQKRFLIFDAKYYVPTIEKGKSPRNVPGVGDITKQYLYQLAYKEFLSTHGITKVTNCFLMPADIEKGVIDKDSVTIKFLQQVPLVKIQIRMISAKEAYELYLSGDTLNVDALELDE